MSTSISQQSQSIYNDLQSGITFNTKPLNRVANTTASLNILATFFANQPAILSRITNLLDRRDGGLAITQNHLNFHYNNLTRNASIYTTAESIKEGFGSQTMEDTINGASAYFGTLTGSLDPFLNTIDTTITSLLASSDPNTGLTAIEAASSSMVTLSNNEVQTFVNAMSNSSKISEASNLLVLCSDPALAPIIGSMAQGNLANAVANISSDAGIYSGVGGDIDLTTPVSNDTTAWYPNEI